VHHLMGMDVASCVGRELLSFAMSIDSAFAVSNDFLCTVVLAVSL
jgi:hypothetical protein